MRRDRRSIRLDANAVRLVFVLSCLLPGPQFVVYLALWVLMPKRPYPAAT